VFFSKETILFMMCCLLIGLDGGNLLFEKEGKRNGKKKVNKMFLLFKKSSLGCCRSNRFWYNSK